MMRKNWMCTAAGVGGWLMLTAGCNTYQVRPLPYDAELKEVVVVDNPKVIVPDFRMNLEEQFGAHGFRVRVQSNTMAVKPGELVIRYDARRSWDFVTYLTDASVFAYKDGVLVGRGQYHHVGQSFSLDIFTKWRGTEWKMAELYERFFSNYPQQK